MKHPQREAQPLAALLVLALAALLALAAAPAPAAAAPMDLADGTYQVDVILEGGSGRASVGSPAELVVRDGQATATIAWSSPHYDYMVVDGQTYLPTNTEGNSTFEIPVAALDEPLPVVADTTAMSVPHEIDYQLTFGSARAAAAKGGPAPAALAVGLAAACLALWFVPHRLRLGARRAEA